MRPEGGRERAVLARWGRFVHRRRWLVLIASVLSALLVVRVILTRAPLDPPDIPAETESGRALRRLGQDLAARPPSFTLIFSSATLSARDPAFRSEVERAVMLRLLDSVLLPLKAVVMNLLSITASFGALVWIFQDGHLASWFGFTPGPIQTATPLIMFCLVFGLSMDCEVRDGSSPERPPSWPPSSSALAR